jgi:hypothetical protein
MPARVAVVMCPGIAPKMGLTPLNGHGASLDEVTSLYRKIAWSPVALHHRVKTTKL